MKILQLHPTLLCYQNCVWCPYRAIHTDIEIPFAEIQKQLLQYRDSCDILKISGGGEPTLYSDFDELLRFAGQLGYKIYLQTNGLSLDSFVREYCNDIRVSFGDGIPFASPLTPVDGFSYVVSRSPEYDNLNELIKYAFKPPNPPFQGDIKNGMYLRVTQDDTDLENVPTIDEIKAHINVDFNNPHAHLWKEDIIQSGTSEVNRLTGFGFSVRFWDALDYRRGKNPCPCYDSPLLTPLGWFPCCKTHVAKGLSTGYNQTMALGWEYPRIPYDGSECSRCYYGHNDD